MKDFFKVQTLEQVLENITDFLPVETESVDVRQSLDRISSADITAVENLPDFPRATMDGYAVIASSTFGASEANPAYLTLKGAVRMGASPDFSLKPGEAAKISTGGMLPNGADSVIMVEHTEVVDDLSIEIYKSIAPGQHVIQSGEDIKKDAMLVARGERIRPQEAGLLAAFGIQKITVYKKPVIGIISTGDEIVPIDCSPEPGKIRDVNSYTLAGLIEKSGASALHFGIIKDNYDELYSRCETAIHQSDMVLVSGGSSVGMRDFTTQVLSSLPDATLLVHGVSISPGKPTILAKVQQKAFWGMPGHVTSAMVVFEAVVRPFIDHIRGMDYRKRILYPVPATLSRNISSATGRTDFIRVKLIQKNDRLYAEPILGKSGLINSMVHADGLVKIDINTEGLNQGDTVQVALF